MNFQALSDLLVYWQSEFQIDQSLPTQYINSKDVIDKSSLWCEIGTSNEVRLLDGSRKDGTSGNIFLSYNETGDFNIILYDIRGEGNGDSQKMADLIKSTLTDLCLKTIEFGQARIIPLVPVDEQYIIEIVVPFQTSFEEQQKDVII